MKKLAQTAVTTGSGTLVYTVPTGYAADVVDIAISNTTTSSATFTLHIVDSGGTPTTANQLFPAVAVTGSTIVQWSGLQTMNSGDFIQAIGSVSGINVRISGDERRVGI